MPSRSYRNNNPGNLRFGKYTKDRGAVDDGEGYAKFKNRSFGLSAMVRLFCGPDYCFLTVSEAIYKYAPPKDNNDTEAYVKDVCTKTGLNRNLVIDLLSPMETLAVISAMIEHEGWKA